MRKRVAWIIGLVAFGPGAAALASPPAFDVNDVSVLFPVERSNFEQLLSWDLALDSGAPLLSKQNFERMKFLATATGEVPILADGEVRSGPGPAIDLDTIAQDYRRWKVVGFRFDPLTTTGQASSQRVELRLVIQPMSVRQTSIPGAPPLFDVQDIAAHVLFEYDTSEISTIVDDLQQLKAASGGTNGVPLGVHPGFSQPGFRAAAKRFLAKTLARGNLTTITFMGLRDRGSNWVFFALVPGPEGSWVLVEQSLTGTTDHQFNLAEPFDVSLPVGAGNSLFVPIPFNDNQLSEITPYTIGTDNEWSLLANVLNPELSDTDNTDCVSCHVANSALLATRIRGTPPLDLYFDPSSERYIVPDGVTGYVARRNATQGIWGVRNFGYVGVNVAISLATLNSTARVVDYLNKEVLGVDNPGRRGCDEAAALRCTLEGNDATSCLTRHCAP